MGFAQETMTADCRGEVYIKECRAFDCLASLLLSNGATRDETGRTAGRECLFSGKLP